MSHVTRFLLGIPGAALVTLVLFAILAAFIRQDQDIELGEARAVQIDLGRQIQDTVVDRLEDLRRPVLDQPPPPPPSTRDPDFQPEMTAGIGAMPDFRQQDLDIGTGFNPDRDAQPAVRIPPQYPARCERRAQAFEYVILEFDVTPEGTVVNPQVVESSNECFHRAAIQAVRQWRYEPRVVGGESQPRRGVQTQLTFELEG